MSDDEVDLELLELLRQSLGISNQPRDELSADTGVLKDAEHIYNNAVDVSIDMWGTKSAAKKIWKTMQDRNWSVKAWGEHELHPSISEGFDDISLINFVFTMDLLNFSFWSQLGEQDRFQVDYQGKRWTGYMSLVASLRRALDEDIPITTPRFWRRKDCPDTMIEHVFRSATAEQMPLLAERIAILREAGEILKSYDDVDAQVWLQPSADLSEPRAFNNLSVDHKVHTPTTDAVAVSEDTHPPKSGNNAEQDQPDVASVAVSSERASDDNAKPSQDIVTSNLSFNTQQPDRSVVHLVSKAGHSAGKLVNLITKEIPSFRDECRYEGRKVRILKRAQIFVADLYGAFNGEGLGTFTDIDHLTMFADYRVPQILQSLGVLSYCPALDSHIRRGDLLPSHSRWEVQLRGCSIYATELLRREIIRENNAASGVNAVLIDFLLYDLAKEKEIQAIEGSMPHHRTRSTNY